MSFKHAPRAGGVFLRQNQQTLPGRVETVNNVLHDGLSSSKVSLVITNGEFWFRFLQSGDQFLFHPVLIRLTVTDKHIECKRFFPLHWFLDEPVVMISDIPSLVVYHTTENTYDNTPNGQTNDKVSSVVVPDVDSLVNVGGCGDVVQEGDLGAVAPGVETGVPGAVVVADDEKL